MKTIFTLLMLPVIVLIYILCEKSYVQGNYFTAYTLVTAWLLSVIFWIKQVGLMLHRQRA